MMGHINNTKVMGSLNVVEACLVENYNDKCIIDSEAANLVDYFYSGSNKAVHLVNDKET